METPAVALVIALLALSINLSVKGYKKGKDGKYDFGGLQEECEEYGFVDEECTADKSGIVYCGDNDIPRVRECGEGYECGKCKYNVYEERYCRCIDSTRPPPFPSSGILTWKGMILSKSYLYPDYKFTIKGEHQITNDGHYLLKYIKRPDRFFRRTFDPTDYQTLTVIIPNTDGTFTEYKGDGTGACTKTTTPEDNRKSLDWIWHYLSTDNPKDYELAWNDGGTQKWMINHDFNTDAMGHVEQTREWYMLLERMDDESKIAIPRRFFMEEIIDEDTETTNAHFKYRSTKEDSSFQLSDYCDDE